LSITASDPKATLWIMQAGALNSARSLCYVAVLLGGLTRLPMAYLQRDKEGALQTRGNILECFQNFWELVFCVWLHTNI